MHHEHQAGAPLRTGDASPVHMHLSRAARLLGGYLYRYSSEVKLHEAMAEVLDQAGISFEREHILDAKNRADFWLDGLVIEVKVDGTLAEALRQVDRYIHLPQVTGVLLASTQRWAEAPLKDRPTWGGKAFQMVRLGRQAL
jgi:hypothetical protein